MPGVTRSRHQKAHQPDHRLQKGSSAKSHPRPQNTRGGRGEKENSSRSGALWPREGLALRRASNKRGRASKQTSSPSPALEASALSQLWPSAHAQRHPFSFPGSALWGQSPGRPPRSLARRVSAPPSSRPEAPPPRDGRRPAAPYSPEISAWGTPLGLKPLAP